MAVNFSYFFLVFCLFFVSLFLFSVFFSNFFVSSFFLSLCARDLKLRFSKQRSSLSFPPLSRLYSSRVMLNLLAPFPSPLPLFPRYSFDSAAFSYSLHLAGCIYLFMFRNILIDTCWARVFNTRKSITRRAEVVVDQDGIECVLLTKCAMEWVVVVTD